MQLTIRPYNEKDYENLVQLYKQSDLYGGQFDQNRDAKEKLKKRIENDPEAIFIAELNGTIVGTISLIEDGRVAWLFRFCVVEEDNSDAIAKALFNKAREALKKKGHQQVLVYAPSDNEKISERYKNLGFTKGNTYTCFWRDI